jgi:hypothetical protein
MDGRWSGRGNEECGAWYIGFVLHQQTVILSRKGLAPDAECRSVTSHKDILTEKEQEA